MNLINFLELIASLSFQAFVVILATHFLSRTSQSEQTQCRLWGACFWVLLALVVVAVLLPHFRWMQVRTGFERHTAVSIAMWEMKIGGLLLTVWCIGVVAAFLTNVVRWYRIRLFLKTCEELDEPLMSQIVNPLKAECGSDCLDKTRLLMNPLLASPFCTQFHRAYVVLPTYLLSFDSEELAQVVRHEIEHIRTGHPLQLFLQRVVEVLFWFHPMVWWASHQNELHREFVCDRAATESPNRIVAYLKTLLRVVEHKSETGPSHSLSFGRGKGSIARRAERLVARAQSPQNSRRVDWSQRQLVFTLAAVSALATQLWVPLNILVSSRSRWSPWPQFTARVLHDFGLPVRDFESYHHDMQLHEILNPDHDAEIGRRTSSGIKLQ